MANNLLNTLANARSRTMIIFFAVLILGGLGAVVFSNKNKVDPLVEQGSSISSPPKIESLPGTGVVTEKSSNLLKQYNQKGYTAAEKAGSSFVPTISGVKEKVSSIAEEVVTEKKEPPKPVVKKVPTPPPAPPKVVTPPPAVKPQTPVAPQPVVDLEAQRAKKVQTVSNAMDGQAKQLMKAWMQVPKQGYVQGSWQPLDTEALKKAASGSGSGNAGNADLSDIDDNAAGALFKAGDILFAVLDTAINSDQPGPVLAHVVQHGPYLGAKLIGTVKIDNIQQTESVSLKFTSMSILDKPNSITINGVAIDPGTARSHIAGEVDRHYMLRYGSLFAATFLKGYAKAVSQAGQTTVQNTGLAGSTTVTNQPKLDPKGKVFAGLGAFGEAWAETVKSNVSTPPTVTVDAGTGFGLLILDDVKSNDKSAK